MVVHAPSAVKRGHADAPRVGMAGVTLHARSVAVGGGLPAIEAEAKVHYASPYDAMLIDCLGLADF